MSDPIAAAATDAEQAVAKIDTLKAELLVEVAKVRAEVSTPAGHMILGVALFFGGVLTGHFL
jgi:hypothetical protein